MKAWLQEIEFVRDLEGYLIGHGSRWANEGFHHLLLDKEMIRRNRCSDDT